MSHPSHSNRMTSDGAVICRIWLNPLLTGGFLRDQFWTAK